MVLRLAALRRAILLFAVVMAAPFATGCVHSHGHGHASGGWRGGGPRHVPPGQVRRAEVHQRNDARKAQRAHGHNRGGRR